MDLALLGLIWGLSLTQFACWIIGIAGIVAVVIIALKAMNVTAPAWVIQIAWVLVIVFVCIGAVMLISSMMRGV